MNSPGITYVVWLLLLGGPVVSRDAAPTSKPAEETTAVQAPVYTLAQIAELVESRAARPHGARFDNQAMGCETYLWDESEQHHVFFFARDGVFYGEFRDERLQDGRFVRITENYLRAGTRERRELAKQLDLPFVRKSAKLHWENKVWAGSTVTWQFITCRGDGTVVRSEQPRTVTMVRRKVTLSVPVEWRPKAVEYYVKALRPVVTEYEKAMGIWHVMPEGGLYLAREKLTDGRCTFWLEWPESDPALLFELHERLPIDPRDAAGGFIIRTKNVASMAVKPMPPNGELVFSPTRLPSRPHEDESSLPPSDQWGRRSRFRE